MRSPAFVGLLLVASSLPWAAQATGLEIAHEPLPCVPADRFAVIVAQDSPPGEARSAEVQFRTPGGGWYVERMEQAEGAWRAVLPRASPGLVRFEYRILMTGRAPEPVTTPVHAVAVVSEPGACEATAHDSVRSSIVVRVPPGAPLVPPVPAGFNPAAVVAAQEREAPKSKKTVALLAGLGVVGAFAAVAATGSSDEAPQRPSVPEFAFNGTQPNPGNTISVSRGGLQVFVLMSGGSPSPLDLVWSVDWRQADGRPECVAMRGFVNDAQSPMNLVLTGPLVSTGSCGTAFEASVATIRIDTDGRRVFDAVMSLPFRFEP